MFKIHAAFSKFRMKFQVPIPPLESKKGSTSPSRFVVFIPNLVTNFQSIARTLILGCTGGFHPAIPNKPKTYSLAQNSKHLQHVFMYETRYVIGLKFLRSSNCSRKCDGGKMLSCKRRVTLKNSSSMCDIESL